MPFPGPGHFAAGGVRRPAISRSRCSVRARSRKRGFAPARSSKPRSRSCARWRVELAARSAIFVAPSDFPQTRANRVALRDFLKDVRKQFDRVVFEPGPAWKPDDADDLAEETDTLAARDPLHQGLSQRDDRLLPAPGPRRTQVALRRSRHRAARRHRQGRPRAGRDVRLRQRRHVRRRQAFQARRERVSAPSRRRRPSGRLSRLERDDPAAPGGARRHGRSGRRAAGPTRRASTRRDDAPVPPSKTRARRSQQLVGAGRARRVFHERRHRSRTTSRSRVPRPSSRAASSTRRSCAWRKPPSERGLRVAFLGIGESGLVEPEAVARALAELAPGAVVALSAVNHETGVIAPLREIERGGRCARGRGCTWTRCRRSVGCPRRIWQWGTTLSVAAHKLRGPKGVGALVSRPGHVPTPVLRGGSQERGLRPGTVDARCARGLSGGRRARRRGVRSATHGSSRFVSGSSASSGALGQVERGGGAARAARHERFVSRRSRGRAGGGPRPRGHQRVERERVRGGNVRAVAGDSRDARWRAGAVGAAGEPRRGLERSRRGSPAFRAARAASAAPGRTVRALREGRLPSRA